MKTRNQQKEILFNVPTKTRSRLERMANKNSALLFKRDTAELSEMFRLFSSGIQKERIRLEAELRKQPEFEAYSKALKSIYPKVTSKATTRRYLKLRRRAIRDHNRRHQPMFRRAARKAKIPGSKICRFLTNNIHARYRHRCQSSDSLYFFASGEPLEVLELQDTEQTVITAPFDAPYTSFSNSGSNGGSVLQNDVSAIAATGTFAMEGHTIAYGNQFSEGSNSAQVSRFIAVPAGFSKLRVTARIAAQHAYTLVTGMGAGGFGNLRLHVSLTGLNGQTDSQSLELFLMLGESYSTQDVNGGGEAEYLVSAEFDLPTGGGEHIVRAGGFTVFSTVVSATGPNYPNGFRAEVDASLEGTVHQITLTLLT